MNASFIQEHFQHIQRGLFVSYLTWRATMLPYRKHNVLKIISSYTENKTIEQNLTFNLVFNYCACKNLESKNMEEKLNVDRYI